MSVASDTKRDKRQMERDITRSMFAIRVAEMRHAWTRNRDDMLAHLPKLRQAVKTYVKASAVAGESGLNSERFRLVLMYLEEAKDDPQHPLYSLTSRFVAKRIIENAFHFNIHFPVQIQRLPSGERDARGGAEGHRREAGRVRAVEQGAQASHP